MPKVYNYSEEIAQEICETISLTSLGLRPLTKKYPHWPKATTIRKWIRENASFAAMYARAKLDQADFLAEQVLEIADDTANDWVENENGTIVGNHDHINRARLRVDSRKWLVSKLAPRVYGDIAKQKDNDDEDEISKFRVKNE